MPAGRPTLYSPEMVAKAREYLDGGYLNNGKVIPSRIGLSRYLGVSPQTLDNWAEIPENAEFLGILADIHSEQHELLINSGLKGEFNAAIAKLALGKHGYSEKTENTIQGPGGGPVKWEVTGVMPDEG